MSCTEKFRREFYNSQYVANGFGAYANNIIIVVYLTGSFLHAALEQHTTDHDKPYYEV